MSFESNDNEQYDPVFGNMKVENQAVPATELQQAIENGQPKKKSGGMFVGGIIGFVVGIVLCAVVGVVGFVIYMNSTSSRVLDDVAKGKSNSKLSYIIELIDKFYYEDVEDQTLVDGIYAGVVSSLDDPYSAYYSPEEYTDLMTSLTGDYAGIGALLQKDIETGAVKILKVYADSPAEKAGLRADDILIYADEYPATEEDLDLWVEHVRGEAGTDVTIKYIRDGVENEVVCTRDVVSTPSVEYQMLEGNIGYIQISQFGSSTSDDFKAAIEDLQSQGMESVIFDLRNNGGGLVDAVTDMLDYVLPEGTTVYTLDKNEKRKDYTSDAETYLDMPIVVLVNGQSASASEIFTGAIKDFEYGTIIGTKTFGKGVVQSTIPLSDGSAVKLTTEKYYTPSGVCIHGIGIEPDIELEYEFLGNEDEKYSVEYDNQIQKAIEILN